jgi:polyhydroxybutyrate depolymerase
MARIFDLGRLGIMAFGCVLLHSGNAAACPGATPCPVASGNYLALPPPGWDGKRPLTATIFFHGWQSSAAAFAGDAAFTASFAAEGVMLVLPNGRNKTWAHVGSPSRARDELAFMDQVRADLLARWPIDPDRILVTGFSQGGSMVWDLACYRGRDYRAFVAVSGAFWEPLPQRCASGPIDLLHLHGTNDDMVPMAGQAIGESWRQGDVLQGLAVLRAADGCPAAPAREETVMGLRCKIWDDCASGRELRLCLHAGGHLMPEGWVHLAHGWAHGLGAREEGG